MRQDWDDEGVARPYCTVNGAKKAAPYGDPWRTHLANPVIWGVAKSLLQSPANAFDVVQVHQCLAEQRACRGGPNAWHQHTAVGKPLTGLTVIDLGCGEGYLGRWLSHCGASYIGVDSSATMLRYARARCRARPESLSFEPRDLELPDGTSLCLKTHVGDGPLLVTGIVVLDHLEEPARLLRELSEEFAAQRDRCAFAFVVLNIDYFRPDIDWQVGTIHSEAEIKSAKAKVNVVFRSRRDWEVLFRDAGLLVHGIVPLRFPSNENPDAADSMVSGIPPFLSIVCRPRGVSANLEGNTTVADALMQLNQAGRLEKEVCLAQYANDLTIREFADGEFIIGANNLGGDLFLILAGHAQLLMNGDVAEVFEPGEMFGDLEAGFGLLSRHYPYPVAAAGTTKVLCIPESVVNRLKVDHGECQGWRLFSQLRTRLAHMIWRFNIRRNDLPKNVRVPWFNVANACRVARAMLAASERSARDISSNPVAGSLSGARWPMAVELSHSAFQREHRLAASDDLNEILRAFVELGFVDAFTSKSLKARYTDLLRDQWLETVRQSLELLAPGKLGRQGEAFALRLRGNSSRVAQQLVYWRHGAEHLTQVAHDFLEDLPIKRSGRRDIWWHWLVHTSRFFDSGCPFVFVMIHDLDALRLIALAHDQDEAGDKRIISLIQSARKSATLVQTRRDANAMPLSYELLCVGAPEGRVRKYVTGFFSFRLETLRRALLRSQTRS